MLLVVLCLAFLASLLLPSIGRARELAKQAVVGADLQGVATARALAEGITDTRSDTDRVDGRQERPFGSDDLDGPAPRIRTFFPETMLWRPEVITDPRGQAELTFPLADSITTWRVSGSAVGHDGRLGAVASAIRVFQPFFVDVDAPAELTAGDEISLPLIVYNYTRNVLDVSLRAKATGGLEIVGRAALGLRLASGQVRGTLVRVRAMSAGEARVTLVLDQNQDERNRVSVADFVRCIRTMTGVTVPREKVVTPPDKADGRIPLYVGEENQLAIPPPE